MADWTWLDDLKEAAQEASEAGAVSAGAVLTLTRIDLSVIVARFPGSLSYSKSESERIGGRWSFTTYTSSSFQGESASTQTIAPSGETTDLSDVFGFYLAMTWPSGLFVPIIPNVSISYSWTAGYLSSGLAGTLGSPPPPPTPQYGLGSVEVVGLDTLGGGDSGFGVGGLLISGGGMPWPTLGEDVDANKPIAEVDGDPLLSSITIALTGVQAG